MSAPSPSNNNNNHDDPTSYTRMAATGDIDAIGAHCQHPFCHQLDFLPFRCESCRGTYCLDHRSETAHSCPNAGAWARSRTPQTSTLSTANQKPNILNHESQCAHPQCKTLIHTPLTPGVDCTSCGRGYCLKHRLPEDHSCKTLPRPKSNLAWSSGGGLNMSETLGRIRAWGDRKKSEQSNKTATAKATAPVAATSSSAESGSSSENALKRIISPFTTAKAKSKNSNTARMVALNGLKKTAVGDAKIPADKRVYIKLEAVAEGEGHAGAKVPRSDAFYSTEWSVGKVLDAAAKTLAVTNVNNRGGGEKEKLRVFWVDGGRLLEFSEKLGANVKSGDTLVLLRGVGPEA